MSGVITRLAMFVTFSTAALSAQHPTMMRQSLRDIGEISVVIEFQPDARAKERLRPDDRESLQILPRVERKLRMAGMQANPHIFQQGRLTSGLAVKLDVQCSELAPVCAVGVNVRLTRRAKLVATEAEVIGVTWHADHTAILAFDKMADAFAGLDPILDRLIVDYQAVNPKVR
jgi:hypothetical protein